MAESGGGQGPKDNQGGPNSSNDNGHHRDRSRFQAYGASAGADGERVTPFQRPDRPTSAGNRSMDRSARRQWRQWVHSPYVPKGMEDGGERPHPRGRVTPLPGAQPEDRPPPQVYRSPELPPNSPRTSPPLEPPATPPPHVPAPRDIRVPPRAPEGRRPRSWVQPVPPAHQGQAVSSLEATATPVPPSPGERPRPRSPRPGVERLQPDPAPRPQGVKRPGSAPGGGEARGGSGGASNVTPLRPPASRPPRRRSRPTPRPLLYGLRFLILGVGLAAIAGTLLSTLTPQPEPTTVEAPTPPRPSLRALPEIPLGERLTFLDTTLGELQAMAPGLTQSTLALDLDTNRYTEVDGNRAVAAASVIKVPILVAYLAAVDAGRMTLDQGLTLTETTRVGGSGAIQDAPIGTRYPAYEVATQMIITSDNSATEMIIEALGGAAALNQQFQSWGLRHTVIRNPLPDLEGTNTTSPRDLVRLLALVNQGEILSGRSRDRLFAIMQRTVSRDLIPAGLPSDALVYNKTGDIGSILGDVAVVEAVNGKRYVLAVLIERPQNDGRAAELIRRIAEAVHQEMNQPLVPQGATTPTPGSDPLPPESPPASSTPPG